MRKEILKYSQLSNIYINILIEYSPYILENWIITVSKRNRILTQVSTDL